MLDAPVSGSVPQVQSGTLTIMVGGDEAAYREVEPLLRELGSPNYVGDNGQGLALKLAINISLAVQMLAFAEGLLLAERSGVDRQRALEIMEASPIGSPMLRARASIILDPPEEAWFDLRFMHKDIELALETARRLQIPLPTAERADLVLAEAEELGYSRPRRALSGSGADRGHAARGVSTLRPCWRSQQPVRGGLLHRCLQPERYAAGSETQVSSTPTPPARADPAVRPADVTECIRARMDRAGEIDLASHPDRGRARAREAALDAARLAAHRVALRLQAPVQSPPRRAAAERQQAQSAHSSGGVSAICSRA